MDRTPNIGLPLTPVEDVNKSFINFRREIAGDDADSAFMRLDAVVGSLSERQSAVEGTEFTWGMLKNGFPKST